MKRIPLSKGIYFLPNLLTTGSLFCGFYSLVRSISDEFYPAALAIFVAAFFDLLDGRIARLTRTESDFGVEFDSLVDLVSFGLAPGILIYTWGLHVYGRLGWLVVFLFVACGALRLARYNIQIETLEKRRFQGLPIPMAALTLASFILLYQEQFGLESVKGPLALALTTISSLLMVSRIRYRSFKDLDLRGRRAFSMLVVGVGVIWVIALQPDVIPLVILLAYVVSGPIEELVFLKKRQGERPSNLRKGSVVPIRLERSENE